MILPLIPRCVKGERDQTGGGMRGIEGGPLVVCPSGHIGEVSSRRERFLGALRCGFTLETSHFKLVQITPCGVTTNQAGRPGVHVRRSHRRSTLVPSLPCPLSLWHVARRFSESGLSAQNSDGSPHSSNSLPGRNLDLAAVFFLPTAGCVEVDRAISSFGCRNRHTQGKGEAVAVFGVCRGDVRASRSCVRVDSG
jgi:hypothetical protein